MEDEISTGKAEKIPPGYKALMAVIAILTLLAMWLVPDNEQATPPPLPELPATQSAAMDIPQPVDGGTAVIRDGDRARAFIASLRNGQAESDPDTVFVQAKRLQGDGYPVDAHLLYRFAARHGHGQAALVLGIQADPAFAAADNPDLLKNKPEQAYKWYSMAADAGIDEATTHLQALHKHVEQSALAGDEHAQRLLLLWQ